MADQRTQGTISYKIDENFSSYFDEIINIDIANRKTDVGFSNLNKMMIKMRSGTSKIGNVITGGSGGVYNQYFFTDFNGSRHHIKGYNSKVYENKSGTWTDFGLSLGGNIMYFSTVRVPMNLDYSISTVYTTTSDSSGAETVQKKDSSTTGANVGKYLILTDDANNNQSYRGIFGMIIADSGTEYTLSGSGILTKATAGCKYAIYDTLGAHLQICSSTSFDTYWYVNGSGNLIQNTSFYGLLTYNLRKIQAITSSQYAQKQVQYGINYISFYKNIIYKTYGSDVNNPFFHTFNSSLTISGLIGNINDLFLFKGRLVISATSSILTLDSITSTPNLITNKYGMQENSFNDLGVDAYYLSTNKQLYSLSETIRGTLISTNIGRQVNNYLQYFNTNICSGFDGKKLYMYGQEDSETQGVILALDVLYKFWSVYTGLRPSSIISENGITYLSDNNSDIVRYFDETVFTDYDGEEIEQKIVIRDIDNGDVFSIKSLTDIFLWFDNYDQSVAIDTYMALSTKNNKKTTKYITTTAISSGSVDDMVIGKLTIGSKPLGGIITEDDMTYPFLKHIQYSSDGANLWKIVIRGVDGSPFYLNGLDVQVGFPIGQKTYFSPENTI